MQDFDPEEEQITGINVTPLVDITLVLLIIFMVTARYISEPNVGVKLPKSSQSSRTQPTDNNVFLTIDSHHEIFLNNARVDMKQLGGNLKALLKEKPNMNLILRADKNITHGEVMAVLDEVRAQGVTQFGFAVEGTAK
jgi:biopolymer transport protein TolR